VREEVVLFGKSRSLVGIATYPPVMGRSIDRPAVILLNAGLVHRVGPNRLYVRMARKLAKMGFVALRFDYSGIGDSRTREDNLPVQESTVSETQEAMNWLSEKKDSKRFILMGLCSGAVRSFLTACKDPRVTELILINTAAQENPDIRATRDLDFYWRFALSNPKSWMRVISGRSSYRTMLKTVAHKIVFFRKRKMHPEMEDLLAASRMQLRTLVERDVRMLFVFTEWEASRYTFEKLFADEIREFSASGNLKIEILQQTDHTIAQVRAQEHLFRVINHWLNGAPHT